MLFLYRSFPQTQIQMSSECYAFTSGVVWDEKHLMRKRRFQIYPVGPQTYQSEAFPC